MKRKCLALLLLLALLLAACAPVVAPGGAAEQPKLTEDTVAFYLDGESVPVLVSRQDILRTPCLETHCLDHVFDELEEELRPWQDAFAYIEYALVNGYSAFRIADGGALADAEEFAGLLSYRYPINQGAITAAPDGTIKTKNGALRCSRVTVCEREGDAERFAEAFALARQIVASVPEGYDAYETARYLYTYLTRNVRYDRSNYYDKDWHLMYDTLIRQETVCAGFADTFYYLLTLAGIDCQIVYGVADDGERSEEHEWNVACIDGKWYYFDATWDVLQGGINVAPRFFGVSGESLCVDTRRTVHDRFLLPECSAEDLGVPAWWNDTPEGAVKSFLLLKEYGANYPLEMLRLLGYTQEEMKLVGTLPAGYGIYNVEYDEFCDRMERYVTPACFIKEFGKDAFGNEDGSLTCFTGLNVYPAYRLVHVISLEEGVCTAELAASNGESCTATFRLQAQGDRWLVDSFRLQP